MTFFVDVYKYEDGYSLLRTANRLIEIKWLLLKNLLYWSFARDVFILRGKTRTLETFPLLCTCVRRS